MISPHQKGLLFDSSSTPSLSFAMDALREAALSPTQPPASESVLCTPSNIATPARLEPSQRPFVSPQPHSVGVHFPSSNRHVSPLTQIFRSNSTTTNTQLRLKASHNKPPLPSPSRTPTSNGKRVAGTPSPAPPLRVRNGESTTPCAPSPSTQSDSFASPSVHDHIPATFSGVKTPGSNPIIIQPEHSPSESEKTQLAKEQDPEILASFFKMRSAKMLSPFGNPSKKRARNLTIVDVNTNPLARDKEEASEIPSNVPIDTVLNVPFSLSYGFEETLEVDLGCRASRVPLPYAINIFTFDLEGSIKPHSARLERDPDDKASVLVDILKQEVIFSTVPDEDNEQTNPISDALEEACIVFWAAPDAHAERGYDRFVLTVTDEDGKEYETNVEIRVRKTEPIIAVETEEEAPDVSRTETFIDFPAGCQSSEKSVRIWNKTEGGAPLLLNILMRDCASGVFSIGHNSDDARLCIPMYIPFGESCNFSAKFELVSEAAIDHEFYGFALIKYATILPASVCPEDDAELYHAYDHVLNFTATSAVEAEDHKSGHEVPRPISPEDDELREHRFCHPESALHPEANCILEHSAHSGLLPSTPESSHKEEKSIDSGKSLKNLKSIAVHGSKFRNEGISIEPLPIHVSPGAIEEVPTDTGNPVEYCRVFLHQPPKWIPGQDRKEKTPYGSHPSKEAVSENESAKNPSCDNKIVPMKGQRSFKSNYRSYVSVSMAERLKRLTENESRSQKSLNQNDAKRAPCDRETERGSNVSQIHTKVGSSTDNVTGKPSNGHAKFSELENGPAMKSANSLTIPRAEESARGDSQAKSGTIRSELEGNDAVDTVKSDHGPKHSSVRASRELSNSTMGSTLTTLNFQRRESPSAFEYGTEEIDRSPENAARSSHQSFTTNTSAEDGKRYFGFRRLAKNRKPKIKMPRSIRENGVRIRATCGSAILPLFNASSSSIHVSLEIKKHVGSDAAATVSHKMLALDSQQRTNVIITRMSSKEGHLRIIISGYLRGPVKLSTVYHVPLFVEESPNRVPAATGFAVDRPTITFYKNPSRYQYQSLRVLNGTYRTVHYKVWLGGLRNAMSGCDDCVLSITSEKEGTVEGRKCVTVQVRFDSNNPVQYYRQMLHISMDNSRDKVPIFAYTGSSSIRMSVTKEGLFHAENHGNRSGFVVLSGPEIDSENNVTEKVVLLPKQHRDMVAPYGSGTLIYTGDEIARSRFCDAAKLVANAKREGGEEMCLFLESFDGEEEARQKERLLWHRDTTYSLHYAGRLLGNSVCRYRYDPDERRVVKESKRSNDCGWHASIDGDGYVHIENYDTDKVLNFKCKGAEPMYGKIPPLGDAKLAAFLENVDVYARDTCIELYNERRAG
ncbi:unnamed protein product [Agarophyton chilense]|eukprot:gb/GEZJ01000239.1/.p1 GENE.gb/GEZJ01000239.1/~~gb/GEZJ01000239.1/.p1  ORF type:complete len:1363 (+),score=198.84 gb/GEZJ01000239.1/:5439-9527(+)